MLSTHLILYLPLLLLHSIFPSVRVFSHESALHIRWPKYWSFSFSITPSNEYRHVKKKKKDVNISNTSFVTIMGYDKTLSSKKVRSTQVYNMDGPILAYLVCELQTLGLSPSHSLNETTSSFHKEWGSSLTDPFELGLMRESPWSKSCPFSLYLVSQAALEMCDLCFPLQTIKPHSRSTILTSLRAYF